jgi:hypothetical protein
MKRTLIPLFVVVLATTGFAQADYAVGRVVQEADQVKRATMRLAERTLNDVVTGFGNLRDEVRSAVLAQQIDGTATVLLELVRNRRPGRDVRDVAATLTELARQAPVFSAQPGWRQVQNAIADLNRALGSFWDWPGPPGPPPLPERPIIGRVTWRGMVDDRVQLAIRGRAIDVRTISGAAQRDGVFSFTSPLPSTPVEVEAVKVNGRGSVRVIQQPARANDFTAVIEIFDERSGADDYRLDIVWR